MPRTMVVLLQTLTLVLLLHLVVVAATSSASGVGDVRNIHELLRSHGLPAGLLPTTVSSFSFDPSSGLLEAELERPCYARYDGMAYFEKAVRGNLTYGELRGVVGLKQEELFVWLPVKGISVSVPPSGVIMFDIGLARKHLPASLFEVPPDCTSVQEDEEEVMSAISISVEDDKGHLGRKGGNQVLRY
ncbi:uncharacterized protein M6B38_347170 [Iris pallida]|uniref:Uncharacterized protein n=1 Tax=Iris pallida TaxID=29817 RepID=A0AAX6GU18_IRIPA|nr:uncharacterized protein M6B38_347170 [Iris pallida]